MTINQGASDKYSLVFLSHFGFKGWVWRKGGKHYVSLTVGTTEPYEHFSPLWLLMWARVFHFCLECQQNVWHKEGAGCLGRVYVWWWAARHCLLWPGPVVDTSLYPTAKLPSHQQLPAPCSPAPCSLSWAKVGPRLQDYLDQTSSRDAGQVDSSTWEYKPQSSGLLALDVSNYCCSAWEENKASKTIQMRGTVHYGSVEVIKTVTVISNYTGFPVIAQWCWNKWCL